MNLLENVKAVKSVGDKINSSLNNLNIFSVKDLLNFLPRTYEDRSKKVTISEVLEDDLNVIEGYIKENLVSVYGKLQITKGKIYDETGSINVVWYNRPYVKSNLKLFTKYTFVGKCKKEGRGFVLLSPDFEEDKPIQLNSNRIVPVYSLGRDLGQKKFRTIINNALSSIDFIEDFFPEKILKEYNLCSKDFSIRNIHFPKDDESFFMARRRLVFEELFLMQSNLFSIKTLSEKNTDIFNLNLDCSEILEQLPFELTRAQNKVLADIKKDINSKKAMNRLVQGDVGSGKTAVAMVLSYIFVKNGYQVVLMAPTEVLARQHYVGFNKLFEKMDIDIIFLSGSLKVKEKNEIYNTIKEQSGQIIIGTNAVIQSKVKYCKLGLVITDEQHRFGVKQRMDLANKGLNPHILVMTATPIPRTLGLVLYGDLNVSIIDELPPNRKDIETYSVNNSYLQRIYSFMKKEIQMGRQCYVICPLIEENETLDLKSVISFTEELKVEFNGLSVECLHGKMKQEEKDTLMESFSKNEINVLVSTTVIEVGINVPNATVMLIINAERFGLSQLHQLRGRVGRGSEKSYCILVTNSKNESTKERMQIISSTNDGFVISEKDLQIRGQGDFFGVRQHGLPEFKIANLFTDVNILSEVQEILKKIEKGNYLPKDEDEILKLQVEKFKDEFYKEIIL
ncbi:MAG: ATP-dependent DNA helicase RecG [Lachnospirales bacterium]